jgi:predicted NUDIX family phosphoesterase
MSKDDEVVMCVARADVEKLFGGPIDGFMPIQRYFYVEDFEDYLPCPVHWLRRGDCETDPNFKQIIPYAVIRHCYFSEGDEQVFRYRRGAASGEQRLTGLLSLGIGGHVNKTSDDPSSCFITSFYRELDEEVVMPNYTTTLRGFINHETTPVGQVHLGVVIDVLVESPCVYPREKEIAEAFFAPLRSLPLAASDPVADDFELWSKMLLHSNYFAERECLEAPDVIVEVRGGVVQSAYARDETLKVGVLDWDEYEASQETIADEEEETGEDVGDTNEAAYVALADSLDLVAKDFYNTVY